MLGIGQKLPSFKITGVKPGFQKHEENGESAFEEITEASFPGKWKIIFFYPKDFTFVCPTEIAEFGRLSKDFADRDAVVLQLADQPDVGARHGTDLARRLLQGGLAVQQRDQMGRFPAVPVESALTRAHVNTVPLKVAKMRGGSPYGGGTPFAATP